MVAKKKGGGSSLIRSQVVTVRLDPKLKFAAELAARKQRRTLSSFIEWAVEEAVAHIEVSNGVFINMVMNQVWDVEEADRFVKLALNFPELLSYEEERLWKVMTEYSPFWQESYGGENGEIYEKSARYDVIRNNWETLKKIVSGEARTKDLTEVPF